MVLESPANSDDLFNLELVRMAVVDVVSNSGEGREEGSIDGFVVGERDGRLHSPEWFGLNGGTSTCGWVYDGWRHIFLVGVIELAGSGLIRVWEVFVSDTAEGSRGRDWCTYWTFGNI